MHDKVHGCPYCVYWFGKKISCGYRDLFPGKSAFSMISFAWSQKRPNSVNFGISDLRNGSRWINSLAVRNVYRAHLLAREGIHLQHSRFCLWALAKTLKFHTTGFGSVGNINEPISRKVEVSKDRPFWGEQFTYVCTTVGNRATTSLCHHELQLLKVKLHLACAARYAQTQLLCT